MVRSFECRLLPPLSRLATALLVAAAGVCVVPAGAQTENPAGETKTVLGQKDSGGTPKLGVSSTVSPSRSTGSRGPRDSLPGVKPSPNPRGVVRGEPSEPPRMGGSGRVRELGSGASGGSAVVPPPRGGGQSGGSVVVPPPRGGGQSGGSAVVPPPRGGGQSGGSVVVPPPRGGGQSGGSTVVPPPRGGGQSGGSVVVPPPRGGGQSGGSAVVPPPRGGGQSDGSVVVPPPRGGGQSGGSAVVPPPRGGGQSGGSVVVPPPRGGGQSGGSVVVPPPRGGGQSGGAIVSPGDGVREVPKPGGGSSGNLRGGPSAGELVDEMRRGRENVYQERGLPFVRTNEIRGVPAPDKSGNHNMNRRNSGVMVERPAPIRFGHLERQPGRAGTIVRVDGWRYGYWHYDPWWCDRFWYWDYYCYVPVPRYCTPSLYYYYGCLPGYVWYWRVVWVSYPVVVYIERPIRWVYVRSSYYLERPSLSALDRAISDIVDAWRYSDPDLIERYICPEDRIAIFLDGEYSYSMEGYDFAAITRDAVSTVRTKSFSIDRVARRTDDMVVVYATHTFVNTDDYYETVYVAYTLERRHGGWYITEAGSSQRPLTRK